MLAALYLSPLLHCGLADTDLSMAHLRGMATVDGISFSAALGSSLARSHLVDGGWAPLQAIPLSLWFVTTSVTLVKVVQFSLILCNVVTYALFVRKLFGSNGSALLATAITLVAWQFRYPHDPALGSSYEWPWITELILVALYGILASSERIELRWFAVAFVAASAAALSAPGVWPVVVLLGFVAVASIKSPARFVIGTVFIAASAIVAVAGARADRIVHTPTPIPGYYTQDVVKQIFAALPTTYRAFGNIARDGLTDNSSGDTRFENIPDIDSSGWLAILMIVCGAMFGLKNAEKQMSSLRSAPLLATILALWLGPALGISASAYWRSGLPWGQSFDAIYLEQFGVGICGAWLLVRISNIRIVESRSLAIGLGLLLLLFSMGNVRANAFAIDDVGRHDRVRSIVERAGADGFFAAIPIGSTLIVPPNSQLYDRAYGRPSDASYALYHYTGRRFTTLGPSAVEPGGALCPSSAPVCVPTRPTVFILTATVPHLVQPQLALAHWSLTRNRTQLSDGGNGFSAFPSAAATETAAALLSSPQRGLLIDVPGNIESAALAFTATRTCGAVPIAQLFEPAIPTISWGAGFYRAPFVGEYPIAEGAFAPTRGKVALFRWASSRAHLIVERSACSPKPLQVSFSIITSRPALIDVRWPGGRQALQVGSLRSALVSLDIARTTLTPADIEVSTDATAFPEDVLLLRTEGERPQDHRMLVASPAVSETLEVPLNPELNPTGGLR